MPANWEAYGSVHLRRYYPDYDALKVTIGVHDLEQKTGAHQYEYFDRYHGKSQLEKDGVRLDVNLRVLRQQQNGRSISLKFSISVFSGYHCSNRKLFT
jgi:hypothetical protein